MRGLGMLGFHVAPFRSPRMLIASRGGRRALATHIDRWDRDIIVLDGLR